MRRYVNLLRGSFLVGVILHTGFAYCLAATNTSPTAPLVPTVSTPPAPLMQPATNSIAGGVVTSTPSAHASWTAHEGTKNGVTADRDSPLLAMYVAPSLVFVDPEITQTQTVLHPTPLGMAVQKAMLEHYARLKISLWSASDPGTYPPTTNNTSHNQP
jgi:hypothetical protein